MGLLEEHIPGSRTEIKSKDRMSSLISARDVVGENSNVGMR